jgi:hypothetical protein
MSASSPPILIVKSNHQCHGIKIWDGAFARSLGHDGRSLIKESPNSPLPCETYQQDANYEPESGPSKATKIADDLI